MTIGKNIKAIRNSQKITQADLAEMSGISRSHIGDLEGDRYNPGLETLMKIAQALNTEVSLILEGVAPENPAPAGAGLSAFDRREFRGLIPEEIENLAAIAEMFKSSRKTMIR